MEEIKKSLRYWFGSPRKKKRRKRYVVTKIRRDGEVYVKGWGWIDPADNSWEGVKLIFPHNKFYRKGNKIYSRKKVFVKKRKRKRRNKKK